MSFKIARFSAKFQAFYFPNAKQKLLYREIMSKDYVSTQVCKFL
jgi:hypothetical protein